MLKYLKKKWDITKEDDTDILKIYEGNSKAWDFLIIILSDIPFGLTRQCNDNAHEAWMELIERYEVSEEKRDNLNEVQTGGTYAESRTQAKILTYGSMKYII